MNFNTFSIPRKVHLTSNELFWLKIPLRAISSETINLLLSDTSLILETEVPGTSKDGGPNCATVKPFAGWDLVTR